MAQAKVALVTGGASGMGLATCKLLASKGWKLSILDMNAEAGTERAKEIGGIFCKADVTNYESLSLAFLRTWKEFGRLDFVFANAGILGKANWFAKHSEDENGLPPPPDLLASRVMYDGVLLTVYLGQCFLRKNPTPGGSIVVLASSGGIYPSPRNPLYSSSKAGVIGFVRSVAVGLSTENIHVSCVCPGSVATGLMTPQQFATMNQDMFTSPEKIAEIVVMLLKQEEEYRGAAVEVVAGEHFLRWRPDYCNENMAKCWASMGGSTPTHDGGLSHPKNPRRYD
ncbi:hypothetical protein LTR10_017580 [Elasticomyces elasticus]|uniref:Uncharacterized protein n=1 Tax=Exophiala sideris TaxID=1016849 RepID=A0ABR0J0X7_9EURO|nr:hypothetical protein LTR10_017580 [Elasticomyces elasticus]KAK5023412.1 hypothetical protein LTS07_009287 [Exophiala sideris]KAK5028212.1 hypothetical protein LTR13_009200 [Exophiala sideris]KAK5052870.1 hypothetical protein LTR69_009696 [Exophiala sideris]KAK5178481.1 hypothetical protein LTR44_009106 [Eurotiomycetes sp. CCFEE 6388]